MTGYDVPSDNTDVSHINLTAIFRRPMVTLTSDLDGKSAVTPEIAPHGAQLASTTFDPACMSPTTKVAS